MFIKEQRALSHTFSELLKPVNWCGWGPCTSSGIAMGSELPGQSSRGVVINMLWHSHIIPYHTLSTVHRSVSFIDKEGTALLFDVGVTARHRGYTMIAKQCMHIIWSARSQCWVVQTCWDHAMRPPATQKYSKEADIRLHPTMWLHYWCLLEAAGGRLGWREEEGSQWKRGEDNPG